MKNTAETYLTVTDLEKRLRLLKIACPRTISAGVYRVLVGGEWVQIHAAEPRISTGAAPLRALEFAGFGSDAEHVVRLEAELRAGFGPLQMTAGEQPAFSVSFEEVRGWFYLYGDFHHRDRDDGRRPCRIRLGGSDIHGLAFDAACGDRSGLVMTELSPDDEGAVIRAFVNQQPITVERIPWG